MNRSSGTVRDQDEIWNTSKNISHTLVGWLRDKSEPVFELVADSGLVHLHIDGLHGGVIRRKPVLHPQLSQWKRCVKRHLYKPEAFCKQVLGLMGLK